MIWYKEWASSVKARKGRMLPIKAFDTILKYRDPGYSSVYMFKEEDAKQLLENESSRGMNQFEVASDKLMLDIDKGIDGLATVGRKIEAEGIAFDVWESGGKGYHIEIPHQFVCDTRLPYSHKVVVEKLLGTDIDQVDLTLYQHGRLISLPGRVHPTTKKKKKLLFKVPGVALEIPILDVPVKDLANFSIDHDLTLLSSGLFRAADLAQTPPSKGNRHMTIWSASKRLAEAGLAYDTVLGLMEKINESWTEPKSITEVEAAVRSAFKV